MVFEKPFQPEHSYNRLEDFDILTELFRMGDTAERAVEFIQRQEFMSMITAQKPPVSPILLAGTWPRKRFQFET